MTLSLARSENVFRACHEKFFSSKGASVILRVRRYLSLGQPRTDNYRHSRYSIAGMAESLLTSWACLLRAKLIVVSCDSPHNFAYHRKR